MSANFEEYSDLGIILKYLNDCTLKNDFYDKREIPGLIKMAISLAFLESCAPLLAWRWLIKESKRVISLKVAHQKGPKRIISLNMAHKGVETYY